jgi:histidine triad (HIT) family protein
MLLIAATAGGFDLGARDLGWVMDKTARTPPLDSDTELVSAKDVFADIVAGIAPASVVYRDERVMAFMDLQPINAGHVLVTPVQPARFLAELDEAVAAHLFVVAQWVAQAIRDSGLPCSGIAMFLADGASAGQEVRRVHLHVFPRFEGDGFDFTFPERYFAALPERQELDEVAGKIAAVLESG